MEIYTNEEFANEIISLAHTFNIDAQIIGRVENSDKKSLLIKTEAGDLLF
jgi:phosphoribosylformylglycinamidine cyclo-ligase